MVKRLLDNWLDKLVVSESAQKYPAEQFKRWFDFVGMQRHIKASGIFCRLCYRDGKQLYLNDIPRTLEYLADIAPQYPETKAFGELVANRILPEVLAKEAA
jgi:aminoglycoside/choline kinase family phosphotransferase